MLREVASLLTAAAQEPEVLAEAIPFVIVGVTERLDRLDRLEVPESSRVIPRKVREFHMHSDSVAFLC